MKTELIQEICRLMSNHLSPDQNHILKDTLQQVFQNFNLPDRSEQVSSDDQQTNTKLINLFVAAKKIEGCSENTLKYYSSTLLNMINSIQKNVCEIETNDLRFYLSTYQNIVWVNWSGSTAQTLTLMNVSALFWEKVTRNARSILMRKQRFICNNIYHPGQTRIQRFSLGFSLPGTGSPLQG